MGSEQLALLLWLSLDPATAMIEIFELELELEIVEVSASAAHLKLGFLYKCNWLWGMTSLMNGQ